MAKPKRPPLRERAREWVNDLTMGNYRYGLSGSPDWGDVQVAWMSGYRAAQRDKRKKGGRG